MKRLAIACVLALAGTSSFHERVTSEALQREAWETMQRGNPAFRGIPFQQQNWDDLRRAWDAIKAHPCGADDYGQTKQCEEGK